MPILGIRDNGEILLTPGNLASFYHDKYTLDRVFVAASGVGDHSEFCKLVEHKINSLSDLQF